MLGFAIVVIAWIFLPEVYPIVLLERKAQRLRIKTKNSMYYHTNEYVDLDFRSVLTKQLSRPLTMLFTEPIVTCISLYASFVYGVMHFSLELFPIIFEEARGWNSVVGSLPFLASLAGIISAVGITVWGQSRYNRICEANCVNSNPEARLPPIAFGAISFAVGMFWLAWTAAPSHNWILPCLAAFFIRLGYNCIFQQCLNFLIDVYRIYATSANASVTILRSALAAGLPLTTEPMVSALGIGPSLSIIGAVASVLLPVPLLLMKYGPKLRSISRYTQRDLDI
jgi:hypothetical protein